MALLFRSKKKQVDVPTGPVSPNFSTTKGLKSTQQKINKVYRR
jgi:hypothetical protein